MAQGRNLVPWDSGSRAIGCWAECVVLVPGFGKSRASLGTPGMREQSRPRFLQARPLGRGPSPALGLPRGVG